MGYAQRRGDGKPSSFCICVQHTHARSRLRVSSRPKNQFLIELRLSVHAFARKNCTIFGADRILARDKGENREFTLPAGTDSSRAA